MNPPENSQFSETSFVKTKLFREPLYRADDPELWVVLRSHIPEVKAFFREVGQDLVFDEAEGCAFIRQIEAQENERVPRLIQRQPLSYTATLLLVVLREELSRFETSGATDVRLVQSRSQIRGLVTPFVPETADRARDRDRIDEAINRLVSLGFLRRHASDGQEEFEVMRILKHRFGPGELETVKERLLRYAANES
jgi:hypothetical protein